MELRKINKRGDVTDPMVILLILAFLSISFIVVILANSKISEVISTTALNSTTAAPNIISSLNDVNSNTVQRGFVIFMAILVIGIIGSAFLIRVHPVFLFIYIIVLGFTIFVALYIGNVYDDFIQNDTINAIAADQTMINWIMQHIVTIILAVGALSMIIVFAKVFGTQGGLSPADI